MGFEEFVYSLPVWGILIMAFGPPVLVVLAFLPVQKYIKREESSEKIRVQLLGFASTALIFSIGFSTSSIWAQTSSSAAAARSLYSAESNLIDQVAFDSGPNQASQLTNLMTTFNEQIESEKSVPPLGTPTPALATGEEITSLVKNVASTSGNAPGLIDAVTAFQLSVQDFFANKTFGFPPTLVSIFFLSMVVAYLMVIFPHPEAGKLGTRTYVGVGVFLIGLIQLPLWTLNTRWFRDRYITQSFGGRYQNQFWQETGFFVVVLTLVLVSGVGFHTYNQIKMRGTTQKKSGSSESSLEDLEAP